MKPKIYILLPVHNRRAITERFIDCLVAQTYNNYHLLLIDDGSTDDTDQMVSAKVKSVTVIKGNGDWWWAGSLQQGIDWLKAQKADASDIVLFSNDDITFKADFLKHAVETLSKFENTLLLPQILEEDTGVITESGIKADFNNFTFSTADSSTDINCLSTRGLFTRVATIRIIGDFHPIVLPHYWSDYEYTIRAHKKGIKLITSSYLTINIDNKQTGYRDFKELHFTSFLKQYFSKKSVLNPFYSSIFVLFASPLKHTPFNILRLWKSSVFFILSKLKASLRLQRNKKDMVKNIRLRQQNIKIIIGSASTKYDGWISTNYPLLDLTNKKTFSDMISENSVSNFLAEHVWEHLTLDDGLEGFKNCFLFLKSGGALRIAVPDGFHTNTEYLAQVKPGGYGAGADDHKVLYNYKSLTQALEKIGYKVKLQEWFDENGVFHHEDWSHENGFIMRSTRYDARNSSNPIAYTSLIVDAIKL
jgi:predicted SAM-dependent methyltransferase/GT2 family glycosyltransferase